MEVFFYQGSIFDEINIEELLFYRYKQVDFILEKDIAEGILFINKAVEKRDEERYFAMWLQKYTLMGKDSFVSFNEFYDVITGRNIVDKTKDEMLDEADMILKSMEGGGGNGS